ncbi:MAG: potassium transporter [Ectothiorhodospiraceae bacterium]|nr:potassium transporter [Chromatiales bacterium]MCP5155052.1 potassium transporter [Ectothiorhodospiraceae bacterium]
MQLTSIQRILGILLCLFSLTMVPPLAVSWYYADGADRAFSSALGVVLAGGLALWLPVRRERRELRLRDGFLVVVLFWVSLGLTGSVPLLLSDLPGLTVADAVFESISGLTTTGATVLVGLDEMPPSMLFYRQLLQWLGGMGIIVLAVAVLPMLGVGGMQLYRAETPGPIKDTKLTPRITETAKALWYIYLGLTIACALAYHLAGMGWFDAVGHSFATVAIGGFSTHDASIGHFGNPMVEVVAVVFMTLAGVNFALHFTAWQSRSTRGYLADSELRTYVALLAALSVVTSAYLYLSGTFDTLAASVRHGVFQSVSVSTTTGFTTAGYHAWPSFLPVLLLFASFVGGCAGSTGGGLKVIRVLLLFKQGRREILRLVHPNAIVPIKVGGVSMPPRVVDAVWGFFATYVATFALIMLALMATGMDQVTAFSATAACMNNLGPGLGDVAAHYGEIGSAAKWMLCVAMLLGRLEVFTLLVILSPTFWRG